MLICFKSNAYEKSNYRGVGCNHPGRRGGYLLDGVGRNEDEFFNENLEALMDQEIPQEEKDSCIEEEGRCVYHIDGAWVSVERHIEKGRL